MKKINKNSLIWSLVLFSLVCFFVTVTLRGELKNYIHPDIVKYLYFAVFIIGIMGIYMFNEALNGRGEVLGNGYILFLLPFIIYFVIRPSGLTESVAFKRGINLNFYNYLSEYHKHTIVEHPHEHGEGALIFKENKIVINNSNFFSTLKELYNNPEKHKNNTVVIEGFVLKEDKNTLKNSFILGRMVVSCCAADIEVVGIRCESVQSGTLINKQWIEIQGVFKNDYMYDEIPTIKVTKIKTITEPKEKYLYRD